MSALRGWRIAPAPKGGGTSDALPDVQSMLAQHELLTFWQSLLHLKSSDEVGQKARDFCFRAFENVDNVQLYVLEDHPEHGKMLRACGGDSAGELIQLAESPLAEAIQRCDALQIMPSWAEPQGTLALPLFAQLPLQHGLGKSLALDPASRASVHSADASALQSPKSTASEAVRRSSSSVAENSKGTNGLPNTAGGPSRSSNIGADGESLSPIGLAVLRRTAPVPMAASDATRANRRERRTSDNSLGSSISNLRMRRSSDSSLRMQNEALTASLGARARRSSDNSLAEITTLRASTRRERRSSDNNLLESMRNLAGSAASLASRHGSYPSLTASAVDVDNSCSPDGSPCRSPCRRSSCSVASAHSGEMSTSPNAVHAPIAALNYGASPDGDGPPRRGGFGRDDTLTSPTTTSPLRRSSMPLSPIGAADGDAADSSALAIHKSGAMAGERYSHDGSSAHAGNGMSVPRRLRRLSDPTYNAESMNGATTVALADAGVVSAGLGGAPAAASTALHAPSRFPLVTMPRLRREKRNSSESLIDDHLSVCSVTDREFSRPGSVQSLRQIGRPPEEPTLFTAAERRLVNMISAYVGVALSRALECEAEHQLLYSASAIVGGMMPEHIADQLKQRLSSKDAESRDVFVENSSRVAVLFSEVVGFEEFCNEAEDALEVVRMLNTMFAAFDSLLKSHSVYKVETVGSVYMAATGLPFLKSVDFPEADLLAMANVCIPHISHAPPMPPVSMHPAAHMSPRALHALGRIWSL